MGWVVGQSNHNETEEVRDDVGRQNADGQPDVSYSHLALTFSGALNAFRVGTEASTTKGEYESCRTLHDRTGLP